MSGVEAIRPWLREEHARSFEAAWEWLEPRCRTEEERRLAPTLLLLLAPLNGLVAPCRSASGSSVNLQVTLSRAGPSGPERVRLTVRAGTAPDEGRVQTETDGEAASETSTWVLWLCPSAIMSGPLVCAAHVLEALLRG